MSMAHAPGQWEVRGYLIGCVAETDGTCSVPIPLFFQGTELDCISYPFYILAGLYN